MLLDDTQDLNIWNLVGATYAEAGDLEHARAWFERVLTVEPDNEEALQRLADLDSGT